MAQKTARKASTTRKSVAKKSSSKARTTRKATRGSVPKKNILIIAGVIVLLGLGIGGYALWQNLSAGAAGGWTSVGNTKITQKLKDGKTYTLSFATFACQASAGTNKIKIKTKAAVTSTNFPAGVTFYGETYESDRGGIIMKTGRIGANSSNKETPVSIYSEPLGSTVSIRARGVITIPTSLRTDSKSEAYQATNVVKKLSSLAKC